MGVDVCGRHPINEAASIFDSNWSWWNSLADYCLKVAPDITARCAHWGTNDGDGLDAEDSVALADLLQAEIDSGRCAAYANGVPRITVAVPYLEGNTWRAGKGSERPFSVREVQKFVVFLRGCGGFSIW
jgi:hypothetical protein